MNKVILLSIISVIAFSMMPSISPASTESETSCIQAQYSHFLFMQEMHGGGLNNMPEEENDRFKADSMESCPAEKNPENFFLSIYLESMKEFGYEVNAAEKNTSKSVEIEQELVKPLERNFISDELETKMSEPEASSYNSVEEYRDAYTAKILKRFSRFPKWKQEGIYNIKSKRITLYKMLFPSDMYEEETKRDPLNIGLRWHLTKKMQGRAEGTYCFLNTKQFFLFARGKNVTMSSSLNKDCKIESGAWRDYYTGKTIGAEEVDMDYPVSFSDAWSSGADNFNFSRRATYANPNYMAVLLHRQRPEIYQNPDRNLSYSARSVVASKDSIKDRGGATIAEWLPDDKYIACDFINDYVVSA